MGAENGNDRIADRLAQCNTCYFSICFKNQAADF